jgi:hypothetical protein
VLGRVGLISDDNRKAHIGNTDAIDSYFPVIRKALSVDQRGRCLRLHFYFPVLSELIIRRLRRLPQIFFGRDEIPLIRWGPAWYWALPTRMSRSSSVPFLVF